MDTDSAWAALENLVGRWEGAGEGWFPTIDDFRYRETLIIEGGSEYNQLRFNQTSWRILEEGDKESHSECGFIAITPAGVVEMTSAEANDRMELLLGRVSETEDGYRLDLELESVVHDERIVNSWRTYLFDRDSITYTHGMATTAVPDGEAHLEGTLTRSP